MNKMTRKIMVSVLTLVLTVVALGTTTFAWFTLSNVSTVGNISGTVQSGEGLQFKVIAKNQAGTEVAQTDYISHVDFADDDGDFKTLFENITFKAVEYNSDNNSMETLGVTETGSLYRGESTVRNIDYIELEFVFRSLSQGATVTLENFEVDNSAPKSFKAASAFTGVNGAVAVDQVITVDGKNAARLGIVASDNSFTTYYKPHGVDKDYGQWSYLKSLGIDVYQSNKTNKVTETPELPGNDYSSPITVATLTTLEGGTGGQGEFAYYTGSTTLRIWLDGWDPHAFDPIFEQLFTINFSFKLTA